MGTWRNTSLIKCCLHWFPNTSVLSQYCSPETRNTYSYIDLGDRISQTVPPFGERRANHHLHHRSQYQAYPGARTKNIAIPRQRISRDCCCLLSINFELLQPVGIESFAVKCWRVVLQKRPCFPKEPDLFSFIISSLRNISAATCYFLIRILFDVITEKLPNNSSPCWPIASKTIAVFSMAGTLCKRIKTIPAGGDELDALRFSVFAAL